MRRMNVVRNRKAAMKVMKELDAFPKIPESYKETTVGGGAVSIVVFLLIATLIISEVSYYSQTELKFDYEVDQDHNGKLKINIDMTVAMKCGMIGADVLDLTGQNAQTFGRLNEEPAHFELTQSQQNYLHMIQNINNYIKNEYHAIHKFLWTTGYTGMETRMPPREIDAEKPPDGCRVHGTLTVNKVAGNFHITAGKSVSIGGRGHAHLTLAGSGSQNYNFSHRIDQFSFGEPTPGVVNPLDGDLKIIYDNQHMFQYFIQVVPTKVNTMIADVDTYQYAVTEKNRTISHSKGSHGVAGIFMKYDLSPLKVAVREEHKPYWQFLIRMCGIIGGIFATSGMLHSIVGFVIDVLCCKLNIGSASQSEKFENASQKRPVTPTSEPSTPTTNLMSSSNDAMSSLPAVNLLPQTDDGFTEIDTSDR